MVALHDTNCTLLSRDGCLERFQGFVSADSLPTAAHIRRNRRITCATWLRGMSGERLLWDGWINQPPEQIRIIV